VRIIGLSRTRGAGYQCQSAGPLRVDAVPSSINLASRHHFGGVQVRRDHLRVGFLIDSPIDDARIVRRQAVGPRRFLHSVVLRSPQDLTPRVVKWLRSSQQLQG
jgi:hypothetical protein